MAIGTVTTNSHDGGTTDAAILDQIRELAGRIGDEHPRKIIQNVTAVMQLDPQPLPPAPEQAAPSSGG